MNWLPSGPGEIILLIITVVLVIIIINLFSYTSVQRQVKQSRCYRDKVLNRPGVGIYTATEIGEDGNPIYEVTYDFGSKTFAIDQKCRAGSARNTFEIPVYDLSTNSPKSVTKYFDCEQQYANQNRAYAGYPGIVKYMQYNNTDFFDKMQGVRG